mmetsp:Transcript_31235/g.65463  ORF Transcript_31235/g.65463 Transcript_31235/m.65463 type:complete len:209 (-) Transcript_31235:72-698(-)
MDRLHVASISAGDTAGTSAGRTASSMERVLHVCSTHGWITTRSPPSPFMMKLEASSMKYENSHPCALYPSLATSHASLPSPAPGSSTRASPPPTGTVSRSAVSSGVCASLRSSSPSSPHSRTHCFSVDCTFSMSDSGTYAAPAAAVALTPPLPSSASTNMCSTSEPTCARCGATSRAIAAPLASAARCIASSFSSRRSAARCGAPSRV